jgi:hypothetical protein
MASGASRIRLLDRRLMELARNTYADADARRLAARLRKHCDSLFTFLDCPDVPFDNDYAGRMIRPAVVLRKNGQCNRSEKGAATQAALMSVYLSRWPTKLAAGYHVFAVLGTDGQENVRTSNPVMVVVSNGKRWEERIRAGRTQ